VRLCNAVLGGGEGIGDRVFMCLGRCSALELADAMGLRVAFQDWRGELCVGVV